MNSVNHKTAIDFRSFIHFISQYKYHRLNRFYVHLQGMSIRLLDQPRLRSVVLYKYLPQLHLQYVLVLLFQRLFLHTLRRSPHFPLLHLIPPLSRRKQEPQQSSRLKLLINLMKVLRTGPKEHLTEKKNKSVNTQTFHLLPFVLPHQFHRLNLVWLLRR